MNEPTKKPFGYFDVPANEGRVEPQALPFPPGHRAIRAQADCQHVFGRFWYSFPEKRQTRQCLRCGMEESRPMSKEEAVAIVNDLEAERACRDALRAKLAAQIDAFLAEQKRVGTVTFDADGKANVEGHTCTCPIDVLMASGCQCGKG